MGLKKECGFCYSINLPHKKIVGLSLAWFNGLTYITQNNNTWMSFSSQALIKLDNNQYAYLFSSFIINENTKEVYTPLQLEDPISMSSLQNIYNTELLNPNSYNLKHILDNQYFKSSGTVSRQVIMNSVGSEIISGFLFGIEQHFEYYFAADDSINTDVMPATPIPSSDNSVLTSSNKVATAAFVGSTIETNKISDNSNIIMRALTDQQKRNIEM